jgi:hypothetical protein
MCLEQATERSLFLFSRRQLRDQFGWGDTQLKVHLARLVDMEYLLVHRNPEQWQGYVYELLYAGEGQAGGRFFAGLIDLEALNHAKNTPRSGAGRAMVGGQSAGGPVQLSPTKPSAQAASPRKDAPNPQNAQAAPNLQVVVS